MENKIDLTKLWKLLCAKRKSLMIWGVCGLVLGVVIAFSIPRTYQCSMKFAPEMKSGQRSSMGQFGNIASMVGMDIAGGSGTSGLTQLIYPDIIKSSPFLTEFRDLRVPFSGGEITLYEYLHQKQKSAWWSYLSPTKLVSLIGEEKPITIDNDPFRPSPLQSGFETALASSISIVQEKKTNIYELYVTMQDPEIAAIIADSVFSKLDKYMVEYYTHKSRTELESNELLLSEAQQVYYNADMAYANAKDSNQALVSLVAMTKLDRLQNEKNLAFSVYQQLASQVEMLKIKVQEQTPIATIIEPARVPITPAAPNKKIIVVAFIFLALFIKILMVLVPAILKKSEQE